MSCCRREMCLPSSGLLLRHPVAEAQALAVNMALALSEGAAIACNAYRAPRLRAFVLVSALTLLLHSL